MAVPEAVVGDAEVQQVGQGRQACRRLDDVVIQGQVTQAAECLELVSDVLEPCDAISAEICASKVARPGLWNVQQLCDQIVCSMGST